MQLQATPPAVLAANLAQATLLVEDVDWHAWDGKIIVDGLSTVVHGMIHFPKFTDLMDYDEAGTLYERAAAMAQAQAEREANAVSFFYKHPSALNSTHL